MTCVCPDWKFAANTHLLKLLRLQNKVAHTNPRTARPFQNSAHLWFHHERAQAARISHTTP
jgi:hypothetical protein